MEKSASEHLAISGAARWRALAPPSFVLLCWLLAVRHLSAEWTLNEQYHYGWIVPLLTLYLVRMRLEATPVPASRPPSRWTAVAFLLIAGAEALLLPIREANADWRLLGWVLSGLAAGATLVAFGQAGGFSWMTHFCFPVLFFFTAVPWPRPMEIEVMQWLMQHNAMLAAELLGWLGIHAEVQGNLIRLPGGTVGVDEACSGIRSLQASIMATLYVGEIFALKRWRRVFLLLAGAGWALLTNATRTLFLALMTNRGGEDALDRWHDPAGHWILGMCVGGVILTAWLLRPARLVSRTAKRTPAAAGNACPNWKQRLSISAGAALVGIFLIGTGSAATEAWFRVQEKSVTQVIRWHFKQPTHAAQFETIELSRHVRGELLYDSHSGGRWQDETGRRWVANYFRWEPGRNAVRTVMVHDPRVCLGATGKELVETLPILNHRLGDVVLPFDAYWFREKGTDVFVFNCVIEDARRGLGQDREGTVLTTASRLDAVRAGKRNLGQRRLEAAVWGATDAMAARLAFVQMLREQLVIETPSAASAGEKDHPNAPQTH